MQQLSNKVNVVLFLLALVMAFGFTNINDPKKSDKDNTEESAALGVWISDNGNEKFEIYKKGDKYYGKIIWTNHKERLGHEMFDSNNPDPSLRDRPIVGMEILYDFEYKGKGVYTSGRVYDPSSGHTYKCRIKAHGNTASVRGFIFIPLLGRTETAHRVTD